MINISHYHNEHEKMETRSTILNVQKGQHIGIYGFIKKNLPDLKVYTIHASDRHILVEDMQDLYCAAAQNYMKNGMNAPLELYINMHDLRKRGLLQSS